MAENTSLETIENLVENDPVGALYSIASNELGILLTGMVVLAILGAMGIFSRSIAVPGVLVVLLLPVFGSAIGGLAGQLIAQFGIVVIIYMLYKLFTSP